MIVIIKIGKMVYGSSNYRLNETNIGKMVLYDILITNIGKVLLYDSNQGRWEGGGHRFMSPPHRAQK